MAARRRPAPRCCAGVAALRAGAGKLAIITAESVAAPLGVTVPEAAVVGVPVTSDGALNPAALDDIAGRAERAQAVLIGPGLTGPDATAELVAALVPRLPDDAVVVLDALGLTCGAVTADLLRPRSGRVVVTPNDREMERLLGRRPGEDLSYGDLARLAARELGAVVALRGAIASPDGRAWYGQAGHAGLGTSGSGDVLAGLVTGLAARAPPTSRGLGSSPARRGRRAARRARRPAGLPGPGTARRGPGRAHPVGGVSVTPEKWDSRRWTLSSDTCGKCSYHAPTAENDVGASRHTTSAS